MTVLVTGASGFVGQHLLRSLLGQGRQVVALTSRPEALAHFSSPGLVVDGRGFTEQPPIDLLTSETSVVHLAAVRNRPGTRSDEFERINVRAALNLGVACRDAGVRRFVNVSTAFLYAPHAFVASDTYLSSKLQALRGLEEVHGLPLVTLLPPIVFGPDFPTARNRMNSHIRFVLRAPMVPVLGRGDARRPIAYVGDVITAIVETLDSGGKGRIALAGEDVSQSELDQMIARTAGKRLNLIHLPLRAVLHTARFLDILKRMAPGAGYVRRMETLALEWKVPQESREVRVRKNRTPFDEALLLTIQSLARWHDGIR